MAAHSRVGALRRGLSRRGSRHAPGVLFRTVAPERPSASVFVVARGLDRRSRRSIDRSRMSLARSSLFRVLAAGLAVRAEILLGPQTLGVEGRQIREPLPVMDPQDPVAQRGQPFVAQLAQHPMDVDDR